MHYANGRAAKIGDLVKGKGYNLKHEIIGILVHAKPEESVCNCQVSCFGVYKNQGILFNQQKTLESSSGVWIEVNALRAEPIIEYGQLDSFVALDPLTGEILSPE